MAVFFKSVNYFTACVILQEGEVSGYYGDDNMQCDLIRFTEVTVRNTQGRIEFNELINGQSGKREIHFQYGTK